MNGRAFEETYTVAAVKKFEHTAKSFDYDSNLKGRGGVRIMVLLTH